MTLALPASPTQAQQYTITGLDSPPGFRTIAHAVNSSGRVAGGVAVTGDDPVESEVLNAALWIGGSLTNLGVLGPDAPPGVLPRPASEALGINDRGQVVGYSAQPGGAEQAFIWLPTAEPLLNGVPSGLSALPGFAPGAATSALDIADSCVVVGIAADPASGLPRAVRWQWSGAWSMLDLTPPQAQWGVATAINASGQIAGYASIDGVPTAFMWLPQPAHSLPAGSSLLGVSGVVGDINIHGQVCGHSSGAMGYIWAPAASPPLLEGANTLDLSGFSSVLSVAPHGLSDDGRAVGTVLAAYTPPEGEPITQEQAWVSTGGMAEPLLGLLQPGHSWTRLIGATDTNSAGQIVGEGEMDGLRRAFICSAGAGACPADFNQSGAVTSSDITSFLSAWFADLAGGTTNADFNDSGATTSADITAFLGAWFTAIAQGGCG
ncbi:MAG: hypothetical protein H7Y88_13200 [Phycisphaerales bacterium]|nr:hypothetical protein [Phycisphaerales bacterium]